jgi:hypothetical protein
MLETTCMQHSNSHVATCVAPCCSDALTTMLLNTHIRYKPNAEQAEGYFIVLPHSLHQMCTKAGRAVVPRQQYNGANIEASDPIRMQMLVSALPVQNIQERATRQKWKVHLQHSTASPTLANYATHNTKKSRAILVCTRC